ncbi:unnamed protein product [Nesidiocoris tenuis]|uniref:Uncharacterized protein n=1 Tax=Nesidiocoris tenuis TaxID=355587 RepID=A0A6H5HKK1_9HEMI|nr:unnamed protein product [Nesidiocoris tenuis]
MTSLQLSTKLFYDFFNFLQSHTDVNFLLGGTRMLELSCTAHPYNRRAPAPWSHNSVATQASFLANANASRLRRSRRSSYRRIKLIFPVALHVTDGSASCYSDVNDGTEMYPYSADQTRRAAGTRAGRCRARQSEPFDQRFYQPPGPAWRKFGRAARHGSASRRSYDSEIYDPRACSSLGVLISMCRAVETFCGSRSATPRSMQPEDIGQRGATRPNILKNKL